MTDFWTGKKVLVAGGTGFIGSSVCGQLLKRGARVTATHLSDNLSKVSDIQKEIELTQVDLTSFETAKKAAKDKDIVLNLASRVAGIQFNINHPATMFLDNIQIAKNLMQASLEGGVERFLVVSSACVYPRHCSIPTPETEGFLEDPEPTNLGYGWAKRVAELMGRFYEKEYGMKVGIARPYNAYGPKDDFDPETSHVIPGIIRRVFEGENPLTVWGSGTQTRSFLYVEDFARGLIEVIEKYPEADPINIGTEEEISIGDLAKMIVRISGKSINIEFDKSKPDGQPRRNCDTVKAKKLIGFKAEFGLEEGLEKTIDWYRNNLNSRP
jgi:GDP-L-fucose synthase